MTFGLRSQSTSNRFSLNFVPTTLPGCVMWLRADKGVTLDGSNNVSFWADQSGAGHSVQSVSPSQNPSYSGSAGPNGTAYLGFQGGTTQALSGTFAPAYPFDIFAVVRATDSSQPRYIYDFATGNNVDAAATQAGTTILFFPAISSGGNTYVPGSDFVFEGFATGTAATSGQALNNITFVQATGNQGATGKTVIGDRADFSANAWNGRIYEIVMFNRVLNPPERTMLCRYFAVRYAFGVP